MSYRRHAVAVLTFTCIALLAYACADGSPSAPDDASASEASPAAVTGFSSSSTSPSGDGLLHACYNSRSGSVYRIKVSGLPDECRSAKDLEFSWPASALLAGQNCPEGEFVTGVDADGSIICSAPGNSNSTVDADGDGFSSDTDCDDDDPDTYPGAPELADGKDNDCDGTVDEGT